MTPGSNLLDDAFLNIDTYPVNVYRYLGRTLNAIGILAPSYEPEPVTIEASCQAVSLNSYVQLGLDFNKKYINVYLSDDLGIFGRDMAGDKITVGSKQYEVHSDLDWFEFDGWKGVMCVALTVPNPVTQ